MANYLIFEALQYAYLTLSYSEWLELPEPSFFHLSVSPDENTTMLLTEAKYLPQKLASVQLLDVNGMCYKLDGKLKKSLWQSGKIEPPPVLTAQVYKVSQDDFLAMKSYLLDVLKKERSNTELIRFAYTVFEMDITSERLSGGLLYESLNIALRGGMRRFQNKHAPEMEIGIDVLKSVGVLREELLYLDKMDLQKEIFVNGVLAGALILAGLKIDIENFLIAVNEKRGSIQGDNLDPVLILHKLIDKYKATQSRQTKNHLSNDLCRLFIQSALAYNEGEHAPHYWQPSLKITLDHRPYVTQLRRLKGIHESRDL